MRVRLHGREVSRGVFAVCVFGVEDVLDRALHQRGVRRERHGEPDRDALRVPAHGPGVHDLAAVSQHLHHGDRRDHREHAEGGPRPDRRVHDAALLLRRLLAGRRQVRRQGGVHPGVRQAVHLAGEHLRLRKRAGPGVPDRPVPAGAAAPAVRDPRVLPHGRGVPRHGREPDRHFGGQPGERPLVLGPHRGLPPGRRGQQVRVLAERVQQPGRDGRRRRAGGRRRRPAGLQTVARVAAAHRLSDRRQREDGYLLLPERLPPAEQHELVQDRARVQGQPGVRLRRGRGRHRRRGEAPDPVHGQARGVRVFRRFEDPVLRARDRAREQQERLPGVGRRAAVQRGRGAENHRVGLRKRARNHARGHDGGVRGVDTRVRPGRHVQHARAGHAGHYSDRRDPEGDGDGQDGRDRLPQLHQRGHAAEHDEKTGHRGHLLLRHRGQHGGRLRRGQGSEVALLWTAHDQRTTARTVVVTADRRGVQNHTARFRFRRRRCASHRTEQRAVH
mmetsp:Transcript_19475/g.48820  ORF Transcript_19475/g.48820 Transcript_19475/m.48820 type:complete len:502 (+) Transcript_19475:2294-3799(+)